MGISYKSYLYTRRVLRVLIHFIYFFIAAEASQRLNEEGHQKRESVVVASDRGKIFFLFLLDFVFFLDFSVRGIIILMYSASRTSGHRDLWLFLFVFFFFFRFFLSAQQCLRFPLLPVYYLLLSVSVSRQDMEEGKILLLIRSLPHLVVSSCRGERREEESNS